VTPTKAIPHAPNSYHFFASTSRRQPFRFQWALAMRISTLSGQAVLLLHRRQWLATSLQTPPLRVPIALPNLAPAGVLPNSTTGGVGIFRLTVALLALPPYRRLDFGFTSTIKHLPTVGHHNGIRRRGKWKEIVLFESGTLWMLAAWRLQERSGRISKLCEEGANPRPAADGNRKRRGSAAEPHRVTRQGTEYYWRRVR